MRLLTFFHLLLALCVGFQAAGANTQATLLLSAETAQPGTTIWAGVQLKMAEGWHTYWKNPGEAGQATEIKWELPPGVTAGEIQWPLPHKIPPADITTYGYENEAVLLVSLKIATNFPPGEIALKANVSWLECKESCIPASQLVEARLNIGRETISSANTANLDWWLQKVPVSAPYFPVNVWWQEGGEANSRMLNLQWPSFKSNADFFPFASENFEVSGSTETISAPDGFVHLRKLVKKFSGEWPGEITGIFISGSNAVQSTAKISSQPKEASAAPVRTQSQALWRMLLFAFIGGLILNIMPCVLPVIALKILGFVSEAKSEPRQVRRLGLVYALGVLVSFLGLAALVIGAKAAGSHAGWGMQFGSPIFIICLTTLVTLVALNLFGVFEVTLGGRALDAASELSSRSGASGAFFNGVLATTLATPCTAPFLAPALGFAFAQSAPIIVLVFLTVGLGLAAPYVLLSWNPAWLKFLPKPGAWMEKFKVAMGFPMLATAVWLFSIVADNYGKKSLWLGVFLVVIAAAAWVFGEFFQRGRKRRNIGLIIALLLVVAGVEMILERQLNWRHPLAAAGKTGVIKESVDGIEWRPWSVEAVAAARAEGKVALVDFTADWCLTCQLNKKTSIEITSVRQKLKDLGAVALLGDYTHFPPDITAELNRYQRAGVPLVLVYPKDARAPAIVLPEVLTPAILLEALDRAAK